MAHPVSWFEITGRDGKKLQNFYKKVFAWKAGGASYDPMMMVGAEAGGISGGIGDIRDGKASVAVYVSTPDVNAHLKKIVGAGGKIAMARQELPGGMGAIAGFLDPSGNWIGLWEPARKAAKKVGGTSAKRAPKKSATKPVKKTAKKSAKKSRQK